VADHQVAEEYPTWNSTATATTWTTTSVLRCEYTVGEEQRGGKSYVKVRRNLVRGERLPGRTYGSSNFAYDARAEYFEVPDSWSYGKHWLWMKFDLSELESFIFVDYDKKSMFDSKDNMWYRADPS
jgi:hypothetical protein